MEYRDDRKRYREAELIELLAPSLERREPACQHFPTCGGCDWLQWDYQAQLSSKQAILKHALERATLVPPDFRPIIAADPIYGYRNRIQVRQQGDRVGFYRRGSHDIVDIANCAVADPLLNKALNDLRATPPAPGVLRKSELFIDETGGVGRIDDAPHGSAGFSQVNSQQNITLQKVVADCLTARQAKKVLELYCGNGNLTFSFLPRVNSIAGVDFSSEAIRQAKERQKGLEESLQPRAEFFHAAVTRYLLRRLPAHVAGYDTLVLDPPRSGMMGVLPHLVHGGLRNLIYVSCSVDSFTRDIQCLKKNFTLEMVQPIDMFPHTRHIEFVAVFSHI